jgi:hypothetical protein
MSRSYRSNDAALLLSVRIKRSNHEGLTYLDLRLLGAVKFDAVTMDGSTIYDKLRLDQNTFQIRSGFKLIGSKNNGASAGGLFANFCNKGIKARHN